MSIDETWWSRKAANSVGRGANGLESPAFRARKAARKAADEAFAREMGVSVRYKGLKRA